jgi:hypothetical protein
VPSLSADRAHCKRAVTEGDLLTGTTWGRTALAGALAAAALVGAGCGGGGGGGGGDVAAAKTRLVNQCHAGHAGDQADLDLCKCAVDKLQSDHGYTTAKKFDDAVNTINKGTMPPEIVKALSACK